MKQPRSSLLERNCDISKKNSAIVEENLEHLRV